MANRLASRWSLRHQRLEADRPQPEQSAESDGLAAPLPPKLHSHDVARLFHAPDAHELETHLAEAVRLSATLKQLRDRAAALAQGGAPRELPAEGLPHEGDNTGDEAMAPPASAFYYAHELWTARLRTLEMIAAARSSLRTLAESEEFAVRTARARLRGGSGA